MDHVAGPRPTRALLPDLGDTRTAFSQYTDRGLLRAYWLFRFIGNPVLNAIGKSLTRGALALHLPLKGVVKKTIFKHFCGGETIEESLATVQKLSDAGIGSILDYSVEGQEDDDTLDHATREITRTIEAAGRRKDIPFSVFKPSGIAPVALLEAVSNGHALNTGDLDEWRRVQERFERICSTAAGAKVPVLVDAEESWIQPAIDDLARRMMERYNREGAIVFTTVQLYRHDRLDFIKRELETARRDRFQLGVKLVRGAYMEKERDRAAAHGHASPIHASKEAVDRDYDEALRICIADIEHVSVMAGTHNEESSLLLARLMDERGIPQNDRRVWFGQLLGMSDHITYNFATAGYNVAKYVPYGPVRELLPYLIRRAEENTSVAGQTSRELSLITAERKRRSKTRPLNAG
jgi:proline dehydrogenase